MKEFYRIGEDGVVTKFDGSTLASLQQAVGGYITTAPITSDGKLPQNTTAYADDEGMLKGKAWNPVATELCGYPLVGPVAIRATKKVTALLESL